MPLSKILIIIPPNLPERDLISSGSEGYLSYLATELPIGVLSIASFVENHCNVDFKILDLGAEIVRHDFQNRKIELLFDQIIAQAVGGGQARRSLAFRPFSTPRLATSARSPGSPGPGGPRRLSSPGAAFPPTSTNGFFRRYLKSTPFALVKAKNRFSA